MTKNKQDKSAKPAAVELNDTALDKAVGGFLGGVYVASGDVNGDTAYKPVVIRKEWGSATPT